MFSVISAKYLLYNNFKDPRLKYKFTFSALPLGYFLHFLLSGDTLISYLVQTNASSFLLSNVWLSTCYFWNQFLLWILYLIFELFLATTWLLILCCFSCQLVPNVSMCLGNYWECATDISSTFDICIDNDASGI